MKLCNLIDRNDKDDIDNIINEKKFNNCTTTPSEECKLDKENCVFKDEKDNPKDKCKKATLLKYKDELKNSYDVYDVMLLTRSVLSLTKNEKEAVQSLYTNLTVTSKEIIKEIKETNLITCPYCQINNGETIEHYAPKENFPEYSILSKNLIPCCSTCNSNKGTKLYDENGNKKTINFYFDSLPIKEFLQCNLIYEKNSNIPQVSFSLKSSSPTEFKNHIVNLKLLERYNKNTPELIANTLDTHNALINALKMNGKSNEDIKQIIKDTLLQNYNFLKERYGYNYWKGLVYYTLSQSDDYINNLFSFSI